MRVKWNRNLDVPVPQRAQPTPATTTKDEKRRGFLQLFKFRDRKSGNKSNKDEKEKESPPSPSKTTKARKTVTFAEQSPSQVVSCNRKGRRISNDQVDMSVFKVTRNNSDHNKLVVYVPEESPLFKKRPECELATSTSLTSQCSSKQDSSNPEEEKYAGKMFEACKDDRAGSDDRFSFRKNGSGIWSSWDVYKADKVGSNRSASQTRITSNGLDRVRSDFKIKDEENRSKPRSIAEEERAASRIPISVNATKDGDNCKYNADNTKRIKIGYGGNEYLNKHPRFQCKQGINEERKEQSCAKISQSKIPTVEKVLGKSEKLYPDKIGNDRAMSKAILAHKNAHGETVAKKTLPDVEICDTVPFGRTRNVPKVISTDVLQFYSRDASNNDRNTKLKDDLRNVFEIGDTSETPIDKKLHPIKLLDSNDDNFTRYQVFSTATELHAECVFIDDCEATTDDDEAQNMDQFENPNGVSTATERDSLTSTSEIAAERGVFVNDLGGCQGRGISACSAQYAGANKKEFSTETNSRICPSTNSNIQAVQESLLVRETLFDRSATKEKHKYWREGNVSSQLITATTALNVEHVFIHDNELDEVKTDENITHGSENVIYSNKETSSEADVLSHQLIPSLNESNVEQMHTNETACHSSEGASSSEVEIEHVFIDDDGNACCNENFDEWRDERNVISTDSNSVKYEDDKRQQEDVHEEGKLCEVTIPPPEDTTVMVNYKVENSTSNVIVRDNQKEISDESEDIKGSEMDGDRVEENKNDMPVSSKMDGQKDGVTTYGCEASEKSNAEHVFPADDQSVREDCAHIESMVLDKQNCSGLITATELNIENAPVIEHVAAETLSSRNCTQSDESNVLSTLGDESTNAFESDNEIEKVDLSKSAITTESAIEADSIELLSTYDETKSVEVANTETTSEDFTICQSMVDSSINSKCEQPVVSYTKGRSVPEDCFDVRRYVEWSECDRGALSIRELSNGKSVVLPIKITLQFNNNLKVAVSPYRVLNNGRKLMIETRHPHAVIASEYSSLTTRIPSVWEVSGSRDKNSPEIGYIKLTGLDGGRCLVQLNRLWHDVDHRPVKFEELVWCQKSQSSDKLSSLYGKHSRQPQSSVFNKGNAQNFKQQQQQPPVWTTRVELAKEIQRLGTLCEARTKELTHLKMQLKHTSLGFDTFVVLFQYLTEELDAFSHNHLVSELEKTREALSITEEHLIQYKHELEDLKVKHSTEFNELTDKLNKTYQEDIEELASKHNMEIQELKCHHEQQLAEMSEIHMKQYQEAKEKHTMSLIDLESSHQQQLAEMKRAHAEELEKVQLNHKQERLLQENQLKELEHQCKNLKHQAKLVEEALQRDTDTKIQWISAKKADLEKEVDSLKTVLDMKRNEIHALRKENLEMKKELEKLLLAKEKVKMLQAKAEDLQALVDEKVQKERQLSCDHENLKESYEKESKVNKRLSMENEELLWKLKQTAEANFLNSLSGSPEVFEKLFSPLKSPSKQSVSLPPMFFHSVDENFTNSKETISPNTSNPKNPCKRPPLSPRKCSSPVRTPSFVAATPAAPCSRRCKMEVKSASPRKQKHKPQNRSTRESQLTDSTNSDESITSAKSTSDKDVKYESAVQNGIHGATEEMFACSLEKARGCDELTLQRNENLSNCKMIDFKDFENSGEREKPRAFTFELENSTPGSTASNNGQFPLTYCQHMISSFSEEESSNSSSSKNFLFDEHHFEESPLEFSHSFIKREGWTISSPRNHAGEAMVNNLSRVSNDDTEQFYTPRGPGPKSKLTRPQENHHHHHQSFTTNIPDSNNLDTSCEDFLSEPEQTS